MIWIGKHIFEIISAIGSLATFGAFIALFKKDKQKQNQIDRLTGIADILKAQNQTMREQNDLIAQQVAIFRDTSIMKGNNDKALEDLREIEEKRLKLSVRPDLTVNGGYQGYSGTMQIRLHNAGEDIIVSNVNFESTDIDFNPFRAPFKLAKGQQLEVSGHQVGSKHIKDCEYKLYFFYEDKLKYKYIAEIRGKGADINIIKINENETIK